MDARRVQELLVELRQDYENGESPGTRLCAACVELVDVAAAGIVLMDNQGNASALGASDAAVAALEDLQFTVGEGPAVDAYEHGRPVLEPHLDATSGERWPTFAADAVDAGFLGAFSFPLRIGAARLGTLDLYQDHPGHLRQDQLADALAMTDIVTRAVMAAQAAADGSLVDELDDSELRAQVHQAAGMISSQLDIGIADALVRLRSHAYAEGRPVKQVAVDVVERRLRFE